MSLTSKKSYHYHLPEHLIAQHPKDKRSTSRLLHLDRATGKITHGNFTDILDYLQPDDILVRNKTKVIPARLIGKKSTGALVEIFLLKQVDLTIWECLVKPGRRLKIGSIVHFHNNLKAEIIDYAEEGARLVKFTWLGDFWEMVENIGHVPLPPYIKREATEKDKETYQTVYAKERGSVAAPTAGFHFTPEIFKQLEEKGVTMLDVILHVGLGTFRPVKTDDILKHKMHSEHCQITQETAEKINHFKKQNRRIIAIGTTTTRTLESFAHHGEVHYGSRWTNLFLYPGKKLQIIDGLITNFHMPESTLLMLVSAFAGYQPIMKAYREAVEREYRFFSYGDAMVIL